MRLLFTRMLSFALLSYWTEVDLEVVVHEGIIREKPTTKEEARQFLKGVPTCRGNMHLIFLFSNILLYYLLLELLLSPGYSGSHVATVGSVVVTNLTTGKRLGSLDKAEVIYFCSSALIWWENSFDRSCLYSSQIWQYGWSHWYVRPKAIDQHLWQNIIHPSSANV